MQEEQEGDNADTLTGNNEPKINKNNINFNDNLARIDTERETSANPSHRSIYNKSIDCFIESGSNYSLEYRPYNLNPDTFAMVSNLDPREVSDEEFARASRQFSNEDFVRAAAIAYLRYEPNRSDIGFWIHEVESKKGDRVLLLRQMRNSSKFLWERYSSWELPMSKIVRKLLRKFFRPVVGFVRKILKIQDFEILTTINLVLEQNKYLIGASIDQPRAGENTTVKTSTYYIVGWVLARDIQPTTVRLTCRTKTISEVFISQPRPDVSEAYCFISDTHNWGYIIELDIKELPDEGDLRLKAVFPDGKTVAIGLIKFQKF
jgi:hypothetical protein